MAMKFAYARQQHLYNDRIKDKASPFTVKVVPTGLSHLSFMSTHKIATDSFMDSREPRRINQGFRSD